MKLSTDHIFDANMFRWTFDVYARSLADVDGVGGNGNSYLSIGTLVSILPSLHVQFRNLNKIFLVASTYPHLLSLARARRIIFFLSLHMVVLAR